MGTLGCSGTSTDKDALPSDIVCVGDNDCAPRGSTDGRIASGDVTGADEAVGPGDEGIAEASNRDREQPRKELCTNGFDDDGNGMIDCADPWCAIKSVCHENICDDGIDNDEDETTDCKDPDCIHKQVCNLETCSSYFKCMVAKGCECDLDSDCPQQGDPEWGPCLIMCAKNPNCSTACMGELSAETQKAIGQLQVCIQQNCSSGAGGCFVEQCLTEYAACFFGGTLTCHEFYYDCLGQCGYNPYCSTACIKQLSSQGYVDLISWYQCRLALCDSNEDDMPDSMACWNLSGMFACVDVAAGCMPPDSPGKCGDVLACTLHCESLADTACLASCYETAGLPVGDDGAASELFTCVIKFCGSEAKEMVPLCVEKALAESCVDEHAKCLEH